MSANPWWEGALPVEASIECGGAAHRLRWQDGKLRSVDHPDPGGERLLCSLGAPLPRCLRLVDLWRSHHTDVRALTLGSRAPDDQPGVELADLDRHTPEFRPPPSRREPAGLAGLLPRYFDLHGEARWGAWRESLELLSIPATLQVRWAAGVAAHLLAALPAMPPAPAAVPAVDLRVDPVVMTTRELEQAADGIARAILDAALQGRAGRAVSRWAGPGVPVAVTTVAATGAPRLERTGDGVQVALRHDWLTRVWGHDLAVTRGAFTLDATLTDRATGTLHLTTHTGATRVHRPRLEPVRR